MRASITIFILILVFGVQAQNFKAQIERLKVSMLPETSFRFPCGDEEGHGYYIAQGFQDTSYGDEGHLALDINGLGGGNTDLGDTIYSIGYGVVGVVEETDLLAVYYRYNGQAIKVIYFHCLDFLCKTGQLVSKGQAIATIGNSQGLFWAHLHLEMIQDTFIYVGFYGDPKEFYDPIDLLPFYKTIR